MASQRAGGSEYLAHSFTDLMTSLMVIFILLLVVFINNQSAASIETRENLMSELKQELEPLGFPRGLIQQDAKDPYSIVISVPGDLMNFQTNEFRLRPEGEEFLKSKAPLLGQLFCGDRYRDAIENVVVEGHSDNAPYRGATLEESQNLNLKLSQDRSMEVVKRTLQYLADQPEHRACLLEKLSASGRGEQDLESSADRSRRVVFKVRVKPGISAELDEALRKK